MKCHEILKLDAFSLKISTFLFTYFQDKISPLDVKISLFDITFSAF